MDAGPGPRLALLAACLLPACSYEHQYTDPDGPRFDGDFTGGVVPARGETLRVVSYNLAFGEHPDIAIEALETPPMADADVILMQEMNDPAVATVGDGLDLRYVYYPASVKQGKDWGNAVLTRWPLLDDHKVLLPWADPFANTHRIAVGATIDVAGDEVRFYSTHIATPSLGLEARLQQIEAILDHADEATGDDGSQIPTVIGGDLNTADPGSARQVKELFADRGYQWASRHATDTGSAFGFDATLDYVFSRGLEVGDSGTFRGDAGSDHQPIWAELGLP
jgi:endonuclease/exonuclease/phosphatase family metal-dependent hydrolase